ncbi:MAG TPA: HAMP domain-containing sensor histidine kinase, partial [Rhodospirillales bacterium]|nr:HAMP domain-containing sensor histidine kinase [Rhodospirillales bacterium]
MTRAARNGVVEIAAVAPCRIRYNHDSMSDVSHRRRFLTGLSARLLALTICFVMLAEVLIYLPSVARYRDVYLREQVVKAHLAALALEASPNAKITDPLAMDLLMHAGAHAIVLKVPERRMLMLSERMPPDIAATFDLRDQSFADAIGDAIMTLLQRDNRVLRVIGTTPRDPDATVEVLLDETPLRKAMYAFSWRILTLSIIISLITAGLVYVVLQWLMVRPILRLTESMVRFRSDPENERTTIRASRRGDEIGVAEQELAAMQKQLRQSLRQKARLAALGTAVTKIHHDLRNTLATAVLASDRLADIDDPEVQRLAPKLYQAIDRAAALASRTLEFARDEATPLRESEFALRDLLAEVDETVRTPETPAPAVSAAGPALDVVIAGDRTQLFRVFSNLTLNAAQAGARSVRFEALARDGLVQVDVSDDGPGIPAAVREKLFLPFAAAGRKGGSGLGLSISKQFVELHGGRMWFESAPGHGTSFFFSLPIEAPEPGSAKAQTWINP